MYPDDGSNWPELADPIMIAAGLTPFTGMLVSVLLIRNTRATREQLVRTI